MRTVVFGGSGDRPNVPNVGILVSDGHSTVDTSLTLPEARLAKAEGITMMTVIVNADNNLSDMSAIATDPNTDIFFLIDFDRLDSVVSMIVDRLLDIQ